MSNEPLNKKICLTEDEGMNLAALPEETLEELFKFSSFNDQMQLMQVCKKFFNVLQLPVFARKFVLAFEFCVLSPRCPPGNFLMNSKRKFYNIRFGDRVNIWNCGRKLWTKIGNATENVILNSTENYKGFNYILWEFPRVREISIFLVDLIHFDVPETVKNVTLVGLVKKLVSVQDYQKLNGMFQQFEKVMVDCITNAEDEANMKKLYDVDTEIINWTEFAQTEPMIHVAAFNLLNKKQITPADIEKLDFVDLEFIHNFVNLHQISLTINEHGCFFVHSVQNLPQLFRINLFCFIDNNLGYCDACLKFLKESSSKIASLKVAGKKFPRLNLLIENLPTKPIEYLYLNVNVDYNEISFRHPNLLQLDLLVNTHNYTFNSANLPESSKLKVLTIRSDNNISSTIQISNLQMLVEKCPEMEKVNFPKLSIDEILLIEENWPNLIELKLQLIGLIDEKQLVESLQGNFKKLKIFGNVENQIDSLSNDFKVYDYDIELFHTIPTLRRSTRMNYNDFCMIQHGIPCFIPKLLKYETSNDED